MKSLITSEEASTPRNTDPFAEPEYILQDHVDALHCAGYTVIKEALPAEWLEPLRCLSDEVARDYGDAYAAVLDHRSVGVNAKPGPLPDPYKVGMARCIYLWGQPIWDLLDLEVIHAIGGACIHRFQLNDVAVNTAFPDTGRKGWGWHRDYPHHQVDNDIRHLFLWFFFCLDDFTPENGATWVVPGTHRRRSGEMVHYDRVKGDFQTDAYPAKLQVLARAGDLFIVDPNLIHTAGINRTSEPRRAINVRLCYPFGNDQCDHWEVAGPVIQSRVTPRVAEMMRAKQPGLRTRWPYYPPKFHAMTGE